MDPTRILREASPRNNSGPSCFPTPVRGCLDKNSVLVKEVEGGRVGEFRNNEGTFKSSALGMSTGLRGFRVGGVNVIIVMITGTMEDGLEVS